MKKDAAFSLKLTAILYLSSIAESENQILTTMPALWGNKALKVIEKLNRKKILKHEKFSTTEVYILRI